MPFCPSCRYEYTAAVNVCPDCNEKLVDHLEEKSTVKDNETTYEKWIPLARLTSTQMAEMILEGLRAKNIPVVLHSTGGHFGQTGQLGASSYRPIAGGFITVMVPEEFASQADREAEVILGDEWKKAKVEL